MNDVEKRIISLVLGGLTNSSPTTAELRRRFEMTVAMERELDPTADIDEERLLRDLESRTTVHMEEAIGLSETEDHEDWLGSVRQTLDWAFFQRYRRWLVQHEHLPPEVVDRVDKATDRILSLLEDPERTGPWDRRGMVVGQVQSGKTSNYTALICKAADAGYRIIVVLAGSHNSLRSQTQLRLDEGFLGFDTQQRRSAPDNAWENAIGVMTMAGAMPIHAYSLTTSDENGDFVGKRADQGVTAFLTGTPTFAVVKKHTGVLENLTEWLLRNAPKRDGKVDVPILVIDDEADHASINTNAPGSSRTSSATSDVETDPTKVNAAVRRLLGISTRAGYVGYTATPFANIFIDRDATHSLLGKDLFPSAFIEYLRPPSNYLGPARLFGTKQHEPLPLYRPIQDHKAWIHPGHKASHKPNPTEFPESLRQAMRAFVIGRAVRLVRNQRTAHNSMLIHVTSYQEVQEAVREQVERELAAVHNELRYGGADSETLAAFRTDWSSDFVRTSFATNTQLPPWELVERELVESISQIQTPKAINGTSSDSLAYWENREHGLNAIAIGGNKLSRGLTLEGLTVSYYLRAAGSYDTLLQMGRWFGYRPGYEDLCRLWTTTELFAAYAEVTTANEELIAEFEYMCALTGRTPADFGFRVRDSSSSMHITAANKRRGTREIPLNFAGNSAETVVLPCDTETSELNLAATVTLLNECSKYRIEGDDDRRSTIFAGVPGIFIHKFLTRYTTLEQAAKIQSRSLSEYVDQRIADGELTDWTVVLVSNSRAEPAQWRTIAGHEVGLVTRNLLGSEGVQIDEKLVWRFRRILSPTDELLDLTSEERSALTTGVGEPSGPAIRKQRPASRGLLLLYPLAPPKAADVPDSLRLRVTTEPMIGFCFSFPSSSKAKPVKYRVDKQYWNEFYGGDQ
jgi:hypothetical protein